MQIKRISLLGLVLCLLAGTLTPAPAAAGFKCWTNHQGQRECGDAVPPEFAQKGHREFSTHGIMIKDQNAAKTDEELEEQERLANMEAERARQNAIQAEADRVLLRTYTTEQDLMLARNGQLAALDSRIRHTEQIIAKLKRTLEGLRADAAATERSGRVVSEEHHAEVANLIAQIEDHGGLIEQRNRERAKTIAKFDEHLARYRVLRGRSSQ